MHTKFIENEISDPKAKQAYINLLLEWVIKKWRNKQMLIPIKM